MNFYRIDKFRPNQTYPLDYSEYICLLMMFELYPSWI